MDGTFDLDALTRSALQRAMGFEFDIVINTRRITVFDRTSPCKTHTRLKNGQVDADTVKRLVAACMRLKTAHERWEDKQMADKTLLVMAGNEHEWVA